MDNLQRALLEMQEENTKEYEEYALDQPVHRFSARYLRRRKKIVEQFSNSADAHAREYRPVMLRRVNMRIILVAIIIMILATASVIAATKPRIYYIIKESIESWDVLFEVENEDSTHTEFKVRKPTIPEGFNVVSEEIYVSSYCLTITDKDGGEIIFYQTEASGSSVMIDNEKSTNVVEEYNGNELIKSKEGSSNIIVFNDGKYVFILSGNVEETILYSMIDSL